MTCLTVEGFRSATQKTHLIFDDAGITVMVGENGTGKSTMAIALSKLLAQGSTGGQGSDQIGETDYPFQARGPLRIEATIKLSPADIREVFLGQLMPLPFSSTPTHVPLSEWLHSQGNDVTIALTRPGDIGVEIEWGALRFYREQVKVGDTPITRNSSGPRWVDAVAQEALAKANPQQISGVLLTKQYSVGRNVVALLCDFALDRYKVVQEFRGRSLEGARSGAVESLTGTETASVLLNLRIHPSGQESRRYEDVVRAFEEMFPRYNVRAVERAPGNGIPEVQFFVVGRSTPLGLSQVSAGVYESLTFLTNLVGREGLIIFLDHPECHMHPHAMRSLQSRLLAAAGSNQIIVATHAPEFVHPRAPEGIRRFCLTPEGGTGIHALRQPLAGKVKGQLERALRRLGNREAVFARAVILVEDESQQEFLISVATTLGHQLDSHSVSVIPVDGEDGYQAFAALLDGLGIPYLALRDKPWGDDTRYAPERFFKLDMELEAYLDTHGLEELRKQLIREVGKAKPRVAAALGAKLKPEQVPDVFNRILETAIGLAKGNPTGRGTG